MPSKQVRICNTLIFHVSYFARRVLPSSHFHSAATFGSKQDAATWAHECPQKCPYLESCIIVRNKEGTWRCLFSGSFLLSFLAQVVTLLLYLALVSYFSGKF